METQECLRRIAPARLAAFQAELLRKEYSVGTAENYLRAVRAFARWSGGAVDRGLVLTWKVQLTARYAPATVNAMLAGLNRFFDFAGRPECRVKVLRLQRCSFREAERELDRGEYRALVRTARTLGRERDDFVTYRRQKPPVPRRQLKVYLKIKKKQDVLRFAAC